jgi:hypothetical protein
MIIQKDMKKKIKFWISATLFLAIHSHTFSQKIDEDKMIRDIEVAENVLSTMIKQEINQQRTFFGMDIKAYYQEGYGVTFRLPSDYSMPMIYAMPDNKTSIFYSDDQEPAIAVTSGSGEIHEERIRKTPPPDKTYALRETSKEKKRLAMDSARDEYNKKLIKAAKDFVVDYGDFITQLTPTERIIVTNKGENRSWYFKDNKRTHISVEATKADITAFKQGKLTRDQAMAKLKVVNTEYVETKETDLELFASIFNRLYRSDLSKTFFSENNVYYERLKDYGAMFYMQVYSSSPVGEKRVTMPTLGLEDIDEATRDKKVTELYPKFEQDLKESILEYGRTLKTLSDEEVLVFYVTLTKCAGCGIPATLELTIKASVLKEYGTGKIDKNGGVNKFTVKKGQNQ